MILHWGTIIGIGFLCINKGSLKLTGIERLCQKSQEGFHHFLHCKISNSRKVDLSASQTFKYVTWPYRVIYSTSVVRQRWDDKSPRRRRNSPSIHFDPPHPHNPTSYAEMILMPEPIHLLLTRTQTQLSLRNILPFCWSLPHTFTSYFYFCQKFVYPRSTRYSFYALHCQLSSQIRPLGLRAG